MLEKKQRPAAIDLSASLPATLAEVADENRSVILFSAFATSYSSPENATYEQVNMGDTLLTFLQTSIHSMRSFGRRNVLVLTNGPGDVCEHVDSACGFQTPIVPHIEWASQHTR